MSVTCTGDGRGAGDHCCYIDGQVCEFLFPWVNRCSIWGFMKGNPIWENSPVGRFFARLYPGFDCKDWPQKIPNVSGGLCCWEGVLV